MSKETPLSFEIGGIEIQPGFYIDNYRYVRPVGKGGMADVLLGKDPSNQEVAIKVLKANRFKVGKKRFSREFRTLAKMKHPNVIRVDSYGDIHGHPYIAMDYIEGTDLHKTIRAFPSLTLTERWKRVREILVDLVRGLSHIHSHGIVHRDLKPSNILINKKGRCIITDFGIVKELNSDLEASTALVGTWAYASPEQISGQELDHRSDIYSLGIILYAMLSGRRPFAANNISGYLKLHQEKAPRPPSTFIPEIPTQLEDICLRLLEKSPQDRFQSAEDILKYLGENEEKNIKVQPIVVEKIPFFQESTCSQMLHIIQNNLNHITLLIGEEGFGKSRILTEFEKKLRSLNLPFKRLRAPNKQAPYETAIQLAKYIAKESGSLSLHTTIEIFSKTTQKVETNLRHRLFDETAFALRSLLEERPQIFLIDDINLCHESSYDFFLYLQRVTMERIQLPLFVFVTSNNINHRFPKAERIFLKELSKKDIYSILKNLTPNQQDLHLIAQKVHQETDGIPLFLNAFIKQLVKEKALVRYNNKYIWQKTPAQIVEQNFDIPISIRHLVKQKLTRYSEEQITLLELLAVSDRPIQIEILIKILGWSENKIFDILEYLLQDKVVSAQKKDLAEYFELSRRKFSEVLYEDLTVKKRRNLHSQIAELLQNHNPLPNLSILQQIGEHYRCANQPGEAFVNLCQAGIKLWERGLFSAALHNIKLAQPLTKAAKQTLSQNEFAKARYNLLFVRSALAHNKGEWSEAIKHLKTQWRYAKHLNDWSRIAQTQLDLGDVLTRLGRVKEGKEKIINVLLEGRKRHNIPFQVEAYHHLCAVAWMEGDLEKGNELAQKGLALLKEDSFSLPKAKILLSMGAVKASQGQLAIACDHMKEAIKILEYLTRKELLGIVLCNLAEVLLWRGLWEEAHEHAQTSSILSEESMHKSGQTQAYIVLAMAELEMGFYSKANQYARQANILAHTLSAPDLIAISHYIRAQVLLGLENPESAKTQLEEAYRHIQEHDPEQYKTAFELLLSITLLQLNLSEQSQHYFSLAIKNVEQLQPVRKCEAYYLLARYYLLLQNFEKMNHYIDVGDTLATQRAMWNWSLKLKALSLHSPHQIEKKTDDFHLLFDKLCFNMEEEQQSLLLAHLQHVT